MFMILPPSKMKMSLVLLRVQNLVRISMATIIQTTSLESLMARETTLDLPLVDTSCIQQRKTMAIIITVVPTILNGIMILRIIPHKATDIAATAQTEDIIGAMVVLAIKVTTHTVLIITT